MSETDLIRNGREAWVWQSSSNTVTRIQLPARAGKDAKRQAVTPSQVPLTPQQAATQALKAVGPSTRVSVGAQRDRGRARPRTSWCCRPSPAAR